MTSGHFEGLRARPVRTLGRGKGKRRASPRDKHKSAFIGVKWQVVSFGGVSRARVRCARAPFPHSAGHCALSPREQRLAASTRRKQTEWAVTRQDDPYSRVDYRRLIAWPKRIEREWPFFERVFGPGNGRRLLDLGCGTGEHSRFLASRGFDVVGIDSSPAMIEKATDTPVPDTLQFLLGDMTEIDRLVTAPCDGALCVGNVLPHLDRDALGRMLVSLRRRLNPGAPLLVQVVNYDRVFETGQRAMPVNVRDTEDGDGEIVFLRLMTPRPDGQVVFTPSTLRYRPDGDPPLEVLQARNVHLTGWKQAELEAVLAENGFGQRTLYGTVGDVPYERTTSPDIVIVAR